MDKKEIIVLLFSSAVIGALSSAVITAFAQWRERVARKKELILKVSVELTKTYVERLTSVSKRSLAMPDLLMMSLMHKMVQELFEVGTVSDENRKKLIEFAEKAEKADEWRE
jgi:hypothetical protein